MPQRSQEKTQACEIGRLQCNLDSESYSYPESLLVLRKFQVGSEQAVLGTPVTEYAYPD